MSRPARPLDDDRELRLLAAAATAFSDAGYEAASLNRIIADAGWAKSSFYHYFPDKQQLHDHVILTLRDLVEGMLDIPALDQLSGTSFWQAMGGLAAAVTAAAAERAEVELLARLFQHPPAARGPEGQLTRLRLDVTGWLDRAITRGQQLGQVRTDLPTDLMADLALAIIGTTADRARTHRRHDCIDPRVTSDLLHNLMGLEPQTAQPAPS